MQTEFKVDIDFIKEAHKAACIEWKLKLEAKFPDAFKSCFPKLMINNGEIVSQNKGMLVYMIEKGEGTVVSCPERSTYKVGHYSDNWNMCVFEDYKPQS